MTVLHKANPSRINVEPGQLEVKFIVQNLRDWPTQEQTSVFKKAPGLELDPKQQSVYTVTMARELKLPKRIVMRVHGHATENVIVDLVPYHMRNDPPGELMPYLLSSLEFETDDEFEKHWKLDEYEGNTDGEHMHEGDAEGDPASR